MKSFMAWLEKYLAPMGAKISEEKHMSAIRDGLLALTGLIIVGAFVTLIANIPIKGWPDLYLIKVFKFYFLSTWNGTFAILGLLACFSIGNKLAQNYKLDGTIGGALAVAAFVTVTPELKDAWGMPFMGSGFLFTAMITALIAVDIWYWFHKRKIVIKMPDTVPPAVSKAFSALIPTAVVLVVFGLLRGLLNIGLHTNFNDLITNIFMPLKALGGSLAGALIAVILVHLLWSVGAHGGTIVFTVFGPFFLEAATKNAEAFAAHQPIPNIITGPFLDIFVYIGGAGAALGLALLMVFRSKSQQLKAIGKVAIAPALFNINEPLLFGVPLITNPMLFIPFITAPVVITLVSYFAMASGIVGRTVAVAHWASPVIMGGLISTASFMGIVLQLVNVVISMLIYYPFFVAYDKMKLKEEADMAAAASPGKGTRATA